MNTPIISAIDLVTMRKGESADMAIARSVGLAKAIEKLGYHRFWVPEHHGVSFFASASPAVLIGHIAAATRSLRIGSGGVMLLNHSPMIIAEQFGTLEAIYPGRIDLGVGRAVGSSGRREEITKKALRRDPRITGNDFPELLAELQLYLGPAQKEQEVRAIPGQDSNVPVFLLSSSGYSAQLAGELGLPFVFAAHISPVNLMSSINLYRRHFRPSKTLGRPYVMVATLALAAETDEEARRSFTCFQQLALASARDSSTKVEPPVVSMDGLWTAEEKQAIDRRTQLAIVGGRDTVNRAVRALIEQTGADELLFLSDTYSDEDRLLSYSILAETMTSLNGQ
jgi:luciferase family oxidoreductase group 1